MNYSSNKEFMMSQFPINQNKKKSKEKETLLHIDTIKNSEILTINNNQKCLHEHCKIDTYLRIGKGKITLMYKCLDCNECMLDCRSWMEGMAILTMNKTIAKNTTINYQKVLKRN